MPYGRRSIVFFFLLLTAAAQFIPEKPVCTAVDKQDCKEKASLCVVPAYVKLMSKVCPATCGLCVQPTTPTAPPPPPPPPTVCTAIDKQADCKAKASLCTVPAYVKLMSQICAATCGHCIQPPTPPSPPTPPPSLPSTVCTAVDKQADCMEKASLCTVPAYVKLMSQICPATCGHCIQPAMPPTPPPSPFPPSPPACTAVDKAPDCKEKAFLCTNTAYKKLMSQVCAATCGLCEAPPRPPPPPAAACSDKASDCAGKTVLCHQAAYRKLMTRLCAATCKLC